MAGALTAAIASIFSGSAVTADPYYEYTTLLLPGNGTNGAQNNTFLDASTNNFTITRNGNTTQGTFSPFSQTGWGTYFDGSGDYLVVASNSGITLSSSSSASENFTVECFFYPTSGGVFQSLFTKRAAGEEWNMGLFNTNVFKFGSSVADYTSGLTVTINSWNHLAVSWDGTTLRTYVNGTAGNTYTSFSLTGGSNNLAIGSGISTSSTNTPYGYIASARILKGAGAAIYTGPSITVPTAPFSVTALTTFLSMQYNRFRDASTNNATITVGGGTPSVQAFSPFNPAASWSAATYGGSGYFDGSGDYLTVPNNAAFNLSTNDFTLEFFWYPTTFQAGSLVECSSVSNYCFAVYAQSTGAVQFYAGTGGSASWNVLSAVAIGTATLNAWNHIVVVRSGTTFSYYLNGNRNGQSTGVSSAIGQQAIGINANSAGASVAGAGYLSTIRLVNGTSVYSGATITVPTAPLTAITNTSLLLNFTNAGIYDATSKNDLETVGNAQISTAQSKWGGSSMSFDGTTDYLVEPTSVYFGYGTGDFTIEFWLYLNGAGVQTVFSNLSGTASTNPHIYINSTTLIYYTAGATAITGASLSTGVWYHIALCRASGSTRMFINGTQTGSTYADTNNYGQSAPLGVGTYWNGGAPVSASTLNGYLQDVRVTKYARYTANFTAPTAAFPTL